jgi:hypothetical protein
MDENCATADLCTMILSNLSRPEHLIERIMDQLEKYETIVEKMVACYTRIEFNKKKQHLNYLGEWTKKKLCGPWGDRTHDLRVISTTL